jgi:hypothetical protein
MDRYNSFINHLRRKEKGILRHSIPSQTHRILPGHSGGEYKDDNTVECTILDHIKAHRVRWEVYGETGDLASVNMMTGRVKAGGDSVIPVLGAYATHEVCKRNKTGFWSPEQQRLNALKGNTEECRRKKGVGGAKGNQVIKEKGVGIYAQGQAAKSGRSSGLKRKGFYIQNFGKLKYSSEDRLSLSDTFFDYYVSFGKTWR